MSLYSLTAKLRSVLAAMPNRRVPTAYEQQLRTGVAALSQATHRVVDRRNRVVGTCFCARDAVITAAHVCRAAGGQVALLDSSDKRHELKFVQTASGHNVYDESSDLAMLELPLGVRLDQVEVGSFSEDAEPGDTVVFSGYPFGSAYPVAHAGMISAKGIVQGRWGVQIDAAVNKGTSGSPCAVLDKDGAPYVIGVVVTRLAELNLTKLRDMRRQFHEAEQSLETMSNREFMGHLFALVAKPFAVVDALMETVDRYVNVGMGEAVSIDHLADHWPGRSA